ncbi:DUF1266 domain-containing protein [Paenibacillus tyrfis]|uniref:DUF1266 domain-containing protein n=1 Tax=Paenibacillus tyrfis TaxID=1501230 RepID=A0A081NWI2_9BACL|nr:DUF1266 domain-containing protein [Paenibacillus tyrfis]KEQ22805.1 hypothetical protein ET33_20845 [Paenibacillus tyrfis]
MNRDVHNASGLTERWCIALSAVLYEMNGLDPGNDYEWESTPESIEMHKQSFQRDWGIENEEDLRRNLQWLAEEGHRESFNKIRSFLSALSDAEQTKYIESIPKTTNRYREHQIVKAYMNRLPAAGIAAWDLGRFAYLSRKGAFMGYISQEKSLELVKPIIPVAQQAYSGWREYGTGYLAGRQFWWAQPTAASAQEMAGYIRNLLLNADSLWNRLEWDVPLEETTGQPASQLA